MSSDDATTLMPRSNAFLTALVVGDQGTGALVSRSSSHVNSCMHEWYQHKYVRLKSPSINSTTVCSGHDTRSNSFNAVTFQT